MKIRDPRLIGAAAQLGTWAIRGWLSTLRIQYVPLRPEFDPRRPELEGRFLYTVWHEYLLLSIGMFARPDVAVLISQHTDGQLISDISTRLGFTTIRGSTTRGGPEAVRQLLRVERHIAVTPDGPRGPRRHVQPGVAFLAARLRMPIVVTGMGYDRPWRARSWDRFALPRPGSRAVVIMDGPIVVPCHADRDELDRYRLEVEERLERATTLAEEWAVRGVPASAPKSPARIRQCA